jgi:hypothetical protein
MIIEARGDVVKLEGALEKNYWPTVQAAANLLLRQNPHGILVDGGELTSITPEGARTFSAAMDYIERYKARIVVCRLPDPVMAAIRAIPGVRSRLPVAATMEEARASLSLSRSGGIARGTDERRVLRNIMVPLLSADAPAQAATLACRLAEAEGHEARLHLAYVLEVPRHLPLTAPLPEEESQARGILKSAEETVRRHQLTPVSHVLRARDVGEEIIHQADILGANMIVLAYEPSFDPDDPILQIFKTVMDRAPCEVVLHKSQSA